MNTIAPNTPNTTLMALEAKGVRDFHEVLLSREAAGKTGVPSFETIAVFDAVGLVVTVAYHPERKYRYEFRAGDVVGFYDNRDACLFSLASHWPLEAA